MLATLEEITPPKDPLKYELPKDLKDEVEAAIIEIVKATVRQNSDRDQELYSLRQQLEGVSQPTSDGPYPNSCMIQDPTPFEFHSTVCSNVEAAFRQKPWVTLEALRVQDDPTVQKLETMGNVEAELFGFGKALSTVVYNALEGRYAVCGVFYDTKETRRQEVHDLPVGVDGDGNVIDQPTPYDIQDVTESFRFEPIEGWDFFLNPVASVRVQDADHCIQRKWMTKSSLEDGIQNEGFDEDQVAKLMVAGPTAVVEGETSIRSDQLQLMGINEEVGSYYECFQVVGRMPHLFDNEGRNRIPKEFRGKDFLWMTCPAASEGKIFKTTFSPFPVRPYATGKAIGSDNELLGHGVVSALSALSDEITIILRAIIDSVNLTVNPEMKVPEHLQGWYAQKDKRQAGGYIPYRGNDPESIQPVNYNLSGLQLGFELYQSLYQRCAQLVAAQGINTSMGGKQRKAAEVHFMEEILKNKFGLILSNLQRMVEEIFRIYFALRKYHTQSQVEVRNGMKPVEVSKQDFDVGFRIIPHADADNSSSIARNENNAQLWEFAMQNPIIMQKVQMGDFSSIYPLSVKILSNRGIRNPEAILGPEPQPGDPMMVLQMVMSAVQKVVQGQMPPEQLAQAIVQIFQQAAQQGKEGGAQHPDTQNIQPGSGLELPAMPGSPSGTQANLNGNGGGTAAYAGI